MTATRRHSTILTVLGVAFAASAAIVVLQTVTFHALAWDSPSIRHASLVLRGLFFVADALVLVSLLLFVHAERKLRGLTAAAALAAGTSALAGLAGLASRLASPEARDLRSVADALGGAEPITSLACALLVTLALASLLSRRGTLLTVLVSVAIAGALLWKVAGIVSPAPRSIPLTWVAWSIDVLRSAVIAIAAIAAARSLRAAAASSGGAAGTADPYRAAGEGAPERPVVPPPDAVVAAQLRGAASGFGIHRIGFLLRIAGTVGTVILFVLISVIARERDLEVVMMGLMEVTGVVTAVILAVGLAKMLVLPRSARTRSMVALALVALALSALADAGTLGFGVLGSFGSSSYRLRRELTGLMALAWPFSALCAGTSILLVASAVRRLGAALGRDDLGSRSRWVQGLAVVTGTAQIAALFASFAMETTSRHAPYTSRSSAGLLIVALLSLMAFACLVGIAVVHFLMLGEAKRALLAHADKAG